MDRKEVKGLSLEEAQRELEKGPPPSGYFAPPQFVKVPPPDVTTQHVIERRRRLGRYYTKEIALSVGIIGVVTYFAWFFLRAQAESRPRAPAPEPPVIVTPAQQPTASVRAVPPPLPPREQPKPAKPAARPKPAPAPAPEPTEEPEIDPLINRTFSR